MENEELTPPAPRPLALSQSLQPRSGKRGQGKWAGLTLCHMVAQGRPLPLRFLLLNPLPTFLPAI